MQHRPDGPSRPGRGAQTNPHSRFVRLEVVRDEWVEEDDPSPRTEFLTDTTRAVLTRNTSPDVRARVTLNPYRGCEHGCVYCFARPTHEYLGFSGGLDFESKIVVKHRAPDLLRVTLAHRSWTPQTILMSGATDPYQPVERRLGITRRCLEVLCEFLNPVAIITKGAGITRDLDLLALLAGHGAALVLVSVTTLDRDLQRDLEPRAATPLRRLEAIRSLAGAGIPVGAMVAPVIPGLTDHEIPSILKAVEEAGARTAGYVMLRLPFGVKDLFRDWLLKKRPNQAEKVLSRIRSLREGRLNDPSYGSRLTGTGPWADQVRDLFDVARRKVGLAAEAPALSTTSFRRPGQLGLFE